MSVVKRLVIIRNELGLFHAANRLHRSGRMNVIQQRRRPGEALVSHQLFGVESAIGLTERDVTLPGNRAEGVIVWHQRFPRSSCSRSIASKSALKFPAPKLFAPLRWIIS